MASFLSASCARALAFSALAALAMFPLACMTDQDSKKPDLVVRQMNQKMGTIHSAEGFFVSLNPEWDCNADPDTVLYHEHTTYYQIEEGKLWTWNKGACMAHGYTGSNTGLVGHWESPINQERKKSPDAPEDCEDWVEKPDPFTWLQDGKWNLDISEEKVTESATGTAYCIANQFAYFSFGAGAAEEDSIQSQYQITAMNCESAEVKRIADSQIIRITSQLRGDSIMTYVKVGDKSCSRARPFFTDNRNRCEPDTANDLAQQRNFNQCLTEIGLSEI